MKTTILLATAVAAGLIGAAAVSSDVNQSKGSGAQDRGRSHMQMQDKDRLHDRDRIQLEDPAKMEDEDVYGHELMSRDELNQYRKELARQAAAEERLRFQHEHEKRMQERASKQGKDLVSPGQGPIFGGELMSVEERNEYRERLRMIKSEEERLKFEAQHRKAMQNRARALETEIEVAEIRERGR